MTLFATFVAGTWCRASKSCTTKAAASTALLGLRAVTGLFCQLKPLSAAHHMSVLTAVVAAAAAAASLSRLGAISGLRAHRYILERRGTS